MFDQIVPIVLGVIMALAGIQGESVEGILIYDSQSVTLINTGQTPLWPSVLTFVRDDDGFPARFEGWNWGVAVLMPGQCVQLLTSEAVLGIPRECQRRVRWLSTARAEFYFWQAHPDLDTFRVVAGSAELAACLLGEGRCRFGWEGVPRVESLSLIYDTETLWIVNNAPDEVSLARLRFCRHDDPACAAPWRPSRAETLMPGDCTALTARGTPHEAPCQVVAAYPEARALWRQPFTVISPITAHPTTCPAALPGQWRQCIIAR